MTGFDAALLAAALAMLADRPARWWLGAIAPLLAVAFAALGAGALAVPMAALAVCATRLPAPALLLLAAPAASAEGAIATGATWLVATWLAADVVAERIDHDALWWRLRGAPVRLLVVAILYAALAPLGHV